MTQNILITIILCAFYLPFSSHADGGHVGGGDPCKNEIDKHRRAIMEWIQRDEAEDLNFSTVRSKGWTYDDHRPAKSYKRSMLAALKEGKVIVTCYLDPARIQDPKARAIAKDQGVAYRAITLGSPPRPTVCINYEDSKKVSRIDCNYDAVVGQISAKSPNFVLTHHEYASIAGVEERTGNSVSDFSVSNQLAQYEHWESVKVLGPKVRSDSDDSCSRKISMLIEVLSDSCFGKLRTEMPKTIVTDEDRIAKAGAQLSFEVCSDQTAREWKEGFGSTCAGPAAQNACLDFCQSQGYLKYCFKTCPKF